MMFPKLLFTRSRVTSNVTVSPAATVVGPVIDATIRSGPMVIALALTLLASLVSASVLAESARANR